MKKTCGFLSVIAFASILGLAPVCASAQSTYAGNHSTGFGAPLGNGTLSVTDNASTGAITFNLSTGTGGGFDEVAFYFSIGSGGVSDTSSVTDTGDSGRRAISGAGTSGTKTQVNFATGFSAKYAVALDSAGNANLFQLVPNQGYLTYVSGANYTNSSTGNYGFTINASQLGLTAGSGQSFNFVATLSNPNSGSGSDVFRSNETIGASNVDNNSGGNLGTGGTLIYSGFDTYTLSVPEPSTYLGGMGIVVSGLAAFRRARKNRAA